jgi:hypothetical protein
MAVIITNLVTPEGAAELELSLDKPGLGEWSVNIQRLDKDETL